MIIKPSKIYVKTNVSLILYSVDQMAFIILALDFCAEGTK
jgi:hypothetical protein